MYEQAGQDNVVMLGDDDTSMSVVVVDSLSFTAQRRSEVRKDLNKSGKYGNLIWSHRSFFIPSFTAY